MEIIISHINLDFDGLASMIAASKLYPRAKMILPSKLSSSVDEFLALYRDIFPLNEIHLINFSEVTKIIIVDTNSKDRLGDFYQKIPADAEKIIWDHHPFTEKSITASYNNIEDIGAATTLLLEKIISKELLLTSFEATTLALGIYSDTGSFTFGTTTSRDIKAAAFLLEQGANLGVVSKFLEIPLEEKQQEILQNLLTNMKTLTSKGLKITLSHHKIEKYVSGLSLIAHRIIELTGTEVLFIIVEMAGKVFIVGRSSSESLKVDSVVKKFGGGGHPSAGAAVIKSGNLEKIYRNIEEIINIQIKPSITAEQIMSTPVKTVLSSTTLKMAAGIMLRYGHTGLPVVEEGNLLGIISRRDIDKGIHHGLGHAPVSAYMSRKVKTIKSETSLSEIENLMIENNIGRLPVLKDKKLLGIVTRSDVLSTIHGENIDKNNYIRGCILKKSDIKKIMITSMSKEIYDILKKIGNTAEEMNVRVYLIGGLVRDLLLAKKNEDLDIVVEGDGINFAKKIANVLGCKIRIHQDFGTAVLNINKNLKIDIATSRSEYYPYPAALPRVEKAQLKQDLYRRDFTVNALAICINNDKFGTLIDYFSGIIDLKNCIIRVLHNLSFIEDPTRILRAVKFENRLNFSMDQETFNLAYQAVEELKNVSKPRLGVELRFLLQEKYVIENILRLQEMNALKYLLGQNFKNDMILYRVKKIIEEIRKLNVNITEYLLYLGVLAVDSEDSHNNIIKMGLFKKEQDFLKQIYETEELKNIFINLPENKGDIHKKLKNLFFETCILIPIIYGLEEEIIKKVLIYQQKRQNLNLNIGGRDLLSLGIMPGPIYTEILDELRIALLNEEIVRGKESEKKWVLQYLDN